MTARNGFANLHGLTGQSEAKTTMNETSRNLEDKFGASISSKTRIDDLRRVDVSSLSEVIKVQEDIFSRVETSNYYKFAFTGPGLNEDLDPMFLPITALLFYPDTFKRSFAPFVAVGNALKQASLHLARAMTQPNFDLEKLVVLSSDLLIGSNKLSSEYQRLHNAPATTLEKLVPTFSQVQKLQYRRMVEQIGSSKSENFRETMRRRIPRFMTSPISMPSDVLEETDQQKLTPFWYPNQTEENYLFLKPDSADAGDLTLEKTLEVVEKVERAGEEELGYLLRTEVFTQVLFDELYRYLGSSGNNELPIFSQIFGGQFTGEAHRVPAKTNFDYQTAIGKTATLTFSKLQKELAEGSIGLATSFIESLTTIYPKILSDILARSIINHGSKSASFDEITLLRLLSKSNLEWAPEVIEKALQMPKRRIISVSEVNDFADKLLPIPEIPKQETGETLKNVKLILGEADSYAFKNRIQRLKLLKEGYRADLSLELDALTMIISGEVKFSEGETTKTIPFEMNLDDPNPHIEINTLEEEGLLEETQNNFSRLIQEALTYEARKVLQRENLASRQNQTPKVEFKPYSPPSLTRTQRKAAYQLRKEAAEQKSKTRGIASNIPAVKVDNTPKTEPGKPKRTFLGLDLQHVESLLEDENIQVISADHVIKKLERVAKILENSDQMLGKRIRTDSYGEEFEGINLRQVNWVLNGGSTAIRIYFEDIGSGQFVLRGILNKQGESMQSRYIRGLVQKILSETAIN